MIKNTLDIPDPYPNGTWVTITPSEDGSDDSHLGEVGQILEHTADTYQARLQSGKVVNLPQARMIAIPESQVV